MKPATGARGSGTRRRPSARSARTIHAVTAGMAILAAVIAGFAAAIGVAVVTSRPAVFPSAGFLALLAVTAVTVLTPLQDPRREPAPVTGLSFWQLPTGSRLAYVRLPGASPVRPTPIVVLHGRPGVPHMTGDTAFFGRLTADGFDVYRRALPNSALLYLEGAGHNTYQDRPAEVLAALRAFLTGRPLPEAPYTADAAPADYAGPA